MNYEEIKNMKDFRDYYYLLENNSTIKEFFLKLIQLKYPNRYEKSIEMFELCKQNPTEGNKITEDFLRSSFDLEEIKFIKEKFRKLLNYDNYDISLHAISRILSRIFWKGTDEISVFMKERLKSLHKELKAFKKNKKHKLEDTSQVLIFMKYSIMVINTKKKLIITIMNTNKVDRFMLKYVNKHFSIISRSYLLKNKKFQNLNKIL